MSGYDIIGDIHGCAPELIALLQQLGYEKQRGYYSHAERTAIFVGDFIDRGSHNEDVISIVRAMVDAGTALAVMGNHEYNAICYHTNHLETGQPLRPHSVKNTQQHLKFLQEFSDQPKKMRGCIAWFKQLPLWLDLPDLRVIHAEWNQPQIEDIRPLLSANNTIDDDFILRSVQADTLEYRAIETLLKGSEALLPNGLSFFDKEGNQRQHARLCWWKNHLTAATAYVVPDDVTQQLTGNDSELLDFPTYAVTNPPVFFGHYWLSGQPSVQSKNAVCVDYSVGKSGGKLCGYRFNHHEQLSDRYFTTIPKIEA